MNTDQHVARLEALLAKIRHNAAMPRVASAPKPGPEIAEIDEEDLEIEDADIADVDLTSHAKAFDTRAAASTVEVGIEAEPPRSSDRSRNVASTMEEALTEMDLKAEPRHAEAERPSAAPAALGMAALQLDDAQDLGLSARPGAHPVAEDYAPTVELEEPFDAELELDDAPPPSIPDRSLVPGNELAEPADQELATVPPPVSSAAQKPSASEPIWPAPEKTGPTPESGAAPRPAASERYPSAAVTAREVVDREPEVAAPIPLVKVLPSVEPEPAAPELLSRPQVDRAAQPLHYIRATREFRPRTFVELLDASLSLGTNQD